MLASYKWLWLTVGIAFFLRLLFVVVIDPNPRFEGGDTGYLLEIGQRLVTNTLPVSPAAGPMYLIIAGFFNLILGQTGAIATLRIINAIMGAGIVGFVYIIASRFFDRRVGLLSAVIIAISPAFIIEAGNVLTESLFLFLFLGGFAAYSTWNLKSSNRKMIIVGVFLGLATLTRAVAIFLPAALVIHMLVNYRRQSLGLVGILILSYCLTVSTWTVYNLIRWQRFIVAAEGLAANVYIGTTTWCGPGCIDKAVGIQGNGDNESKYVEGALSSITKDLGGYVGHRFVNLTESLLQPHNTVYFPGESIKAIVVKWWTEGHKLSELSNILASDAFWPKLVLYLFHYLALIFGVLGALMSIRHFWTRFPIYGAIGYFLAVHTVLTANPRYLFPIEPFLTIFAVYAIVTLVRQSNAMRHPTNNEIANPKQIHAMK